MLKKLLFTGAAMICAALIPLNAALTMAPTFNANKVILPSSRHTGGEIWKAQVWIVNTGTRYEGAQNSSNEIYNHIWGTPPNDPQGNAWYTESYQLTAGPDEKGSNISWQEKESPFTTDKWIQSDIMGDIYLRRSFTLDKIPEGDVYLACGRDDAPSEWYINGKLVHSETDGWDEGAVVLLTETEKSYLKTGENLMAVHVHQNWGGAYADCGLYEAAGTIFLLPTRETAGNWPCVYKLPSNNEQIASEVNGGCFNLGIDESSWTVANGPFSNGSQFGINNWNSDQYPILVRRHFNLNETNYNSLSKGSGTVKVRISYDEWPVVYLNGEKIWEHTENMGNAWNDGNYLEYTLTEGQLAYLKEGDNVLGVSLRQGGGGGHIDYGLLWDVADDTDYQLRDDPTALYNSLKEWIDRCKDLQTNDFADIYKPGSAFTLENLDNAIGEAEKVYNKGISNLSDEELDSAIEALSKVYYLYGGTSKDNIINFAKVFDLMDKEADPSWQGGPYNIPLRAPMDMDAFITQFNTAITADDFDNALRALKTARRMRAAVHTEDIFPGQNPSGGKFYLYNVGQKLFLENGSDWGTHAALGHVGLELELIENGNNSFKIRSGLNQESNYMGGTGYMDTGDQCPYTFVAVDGKPGVYNIRNNNKNGALLHWNPYGEVDAGNSTENNVSAHIEGVDASNPNAQWKLVTREERLAMMSQASEDNPVDITVLISRPGFNKKVLFGPYAFPENFGIWQENENNHSDLTFENYNGAVGINFSHQLEDLPEGVYRVFIQGFYRYGNHDQQSNNNKSESNAVLFAGKNQSEIPNITSYLYYMPGDYATFFDNRAQNVYGYPGYMDDAAIAFRTGLYNASVAATVTADEAGGYKGYTLPIGVLKTGKSDGCDDWIMVDNIRLYYYGNATTEEAVNALPDPNAYKAQ